MRHGQGLRENERYIGVKKAKLLFELFLSMLKIGLFTFGGGYAMINILDNEFVTRKGWLDGEEFLDLVTVAESTPGPIAINCSTYIGYKKLGFVGALVATVGMCLPSFTIIYLISLFFNRFIEIPLVASAFKGIQACVVFLVLSAGLKMLKKVKKNAFNITVMALTFVTFVTFSLLSVNFSSIFYILIFGALGLFLYTVRHISEKKRKGDRKDDIS
ncbi:MAG: chromate transporter [Clostridia bacterium]|nr:chromate transporter [Clostridia bacterium]